MTLTELKSRNTRNLKITLSVLSVLLVFLNFVGYMIYRYSHSEEAVSTQLWNYFSSDLFELVTISLLLPIIVLVLESHFEFIQSLLENRLKREEAIRAEQYALAQKQREERIEKRLEAVLLTEKMMHQLFNLAIQVEYFNGGDVSTSPSKDTKASTGDKLSEVTGSQKIEDILRAISEFSITGENITFMWTYRLNISGDDQRLFQRFMNIILQCTADVAKYIQMNDDMGEIAELQAALGIIWGGLKAMYHQSVIYILNHSISILEVNENNLLKDNLKREYAIVDHLRKGLKSYDKLIKETINSHYVFLPEISGNEVNAFREALKKAKEYLQENQENKFDQFDGKQEQEDLFYKIPRISRFSANRNYSNEFIKQLADTIEYYSIVKNLIDIAK